MTPILEISNVDAFYGKIHALQNVSFTVKEGEITTLLGSNGAGKSTILKAISALVQVRSGSIRFMGEAIHHKLPHDIVSQGIIQVPEGRRIFGSMTVLENLELGGFTQRKDQRFLKQTLEWVFTLFPRLKERTKQKAGTLSGGEQQMVAIGRALMGKPKLLMLDEPSMGLAPIVVKDIMKIISQINGQGTTVLLVEQNARAALKLAHTGYVVETGEITLSGSTEQLSQDHNIIHAYLA